MGVGMSKPENDGVCQPEGAEAAVRTMGAEEVARRLRDWSQIRNLLDGHTGWPEPDSLAYRVFVRLRFEVKGMEQENVEFREKVEAFVRDEAFREVAGLLRERASGLVTGQAIVLQLAAESIEKMIRPKAKEVHVEMIVCEEQRMVDGELLRPAAKVRKKDGPRCPTCWGEGTIPNLDFDPHDPDAGPMLTECSFCHGTGVIVKGPVKEGGPLGPLIPMEEVKKATSGPYARCEKCGGSGWEVIEAGRRSCPGCNGFGKVSAPVGLSHEELDRDAEACRVAVSKVARTDVPALTDSEILMVRALLRGGK